MTALEADPSLGPEQLPPAQLALHWRGGHQHKRALVAAWRAAAAAAAACAYLEQHWMLEQVRELYERVLNAAPHTGVDRTGGIELAADAARLAVEPERGLWLVETAPADHGEPDDAGRRAALLLRRAQLRTQRLLPGQVDDLRSALLRASGATRLRRRSWASSPVRCSSGPPRGTEARRGRAARPGRAARRRGGSDRGRGMLSVSLSRSRTRYRAPAPCWRLGTATRLTGCSVRRTWPASLASPPGARRPPPRIACNCWPEFF